jgi:hypothetical protein
LGEWQRDPAALQNETDVAYLVAMTENCSRQPASASELAPWATELKFTAVLLTDPAREVYNAYAQANNCQHSSPGGPGCSNAVTVIIDKTMRVRYFGTTYQCGVGDGSRCGSPANIPDSTAQCLAGVLTEIKKLLAE